MNCRVFLPGRRDLLVSMPPSVVRARPLPKRVYGNENRHFYRSAGACPPRALGYTNDGEGNPLACTCGIRGPKPYGNENHHFHRSAGACPSRMSDRPQHGEGQALALREEAAFLS